VFVLRKQEIKASMKEERTGSSFSRNDFSGFW